MMHTMELSRPYITGLGAVVALLRLCFSAHAGYEHHWEVEVSMSIEPLKVTSWKVDMSCSFTLPFLDISYIVWTDRVGNNVYTYGQDGTHAIGQYYQGRVLEAGCTYTNTTHTLSLVWDACHETLYKCTVYDGIGTSEAGHQQIRVPKSAPLLSTEHEETTDGADDQSWTEAIKCSVQNVDEIPDMSITVQDNDDVNTLQTDRSRTWRNATCVFNVTVHTSHTFLSPRSPPYRSTVCCNATYRSTSQVVSVCKRIDLPRMWATQDRPTTVVALVPVIIPVAVVVVIILIIIIIIVLFRKRKKKREGIRKKKQLGASPDEISDLLQPATSHPETDEQIV